MWIALEILRNDLAEKVTEPTRLRCGHGLVECPECGKPTTQVRQAATTYRLLESLGLELQTARDIWDMRHLVHGAKSFDRAELNRLGELLQILRAVVVALLKAQMGIPDTEPPFVGYGAPALSMNMALSGTRLIQESHIDRDSWSTAGTD